MDAGVMGAAGVAGIVGLIIGLGFGSLIGALLILLGSKIVMGKTATFGSAFLAALVSAVAGYVLGFVADLLVTRAAPQFLDYAQIGSVLLGLVITPAIYSALVRISDGRKPSYVQGLLIYLVQLAVIIALAALVIFVFRVPVPGLEGILPT